MQRREGAIHKKNFEFSQEMIPLCKSLRDGYREYVLSNQIFRSSTAIGALVRESKYAESTKDFLHKLKIALKEAAETDYWLELLFRSKYIDFSIFKRLKSDLNEIISLLVAITKTISLKLKRNHNS
jgi:four helix bundle protein